MCGGGGGATGCWANCAWLIFAMNYRFLAEKRGLDFRAVEVLGVVYFANYDGEAGGERALMAVNYQINKL